MATYHRGVQAGLRWGELTKSSQGKWRFTDYETEPQGEIKAILMGYIPYESIEAVDWDGDEYYNLPIIYCHFEHSGEPYEKKSLCSEIRTNHPNGVTFSYPEIADYDDVKKHSRKIGAKHQF